MVTWQHIISPREIINHAFIQNFLKKFDLKAQ